jgi:cytoskeleton protein RodZ
MPGSKLKQAREARQLTLHEIEWATKIRAEFLQALEEDRFDLLPSGTHARGFLRSYARYLGLDADALVDEYNHAAGVSTEIISTRPAVMSRRRDLAVTPGMIVGVALIVLIGIFGFYLKTQFDKYQASRAADAQPTPQLHLSALPTPSPSPTPIAVPSASPSPTGVVLVVRLDAPAWLSIDIDGKPSAETGAGKTYPAGSALTLTGTQSVQIFSGRAGHTFLTLNGKDIGALPGGPNGTGNKTYTRGQT